MSEEDSSALCPGLCCSPLIISEDSIELLTRPGLEVKDAALILDMLDPRSADGMQDYPCRYFDQESRLCSIYERRPGMCSKYPYGSDCEFCNVSQVAPGEAITAYVPTSESGIFGAEAVWWTEKD